MPETCAVLSTYLPWFNRPFHSSSLYSQQLGVFVVVLLLLQYWVINRPPMGLLAIQSRLLLNWLRILPHDNLFSPGNQHSNYCFIVYFRVTIVEPCSSYFNRLPHGSFFNLSHGSNAVCARLPFVKTNPYNMGLA